MKMILDYTKPFPYSFDTKSEELYHKLLVAADKLILNDLKGNELWNEFNITFKELMQESLNDNFYWQYCPLKIYIDNYKDRESEFLSKNKLLNALAFAKQEVDIFTMMTKSNSYPFMYKAIKGNDSCNSCSGFGFEISYLHSVELLPFLKVSTQNKIQFLNQIISSFYTGNPHPRYFKGKGFELFESLKERLVRKNRELADYSFIYRQMQNDGYIYDDIKEIAFRDWLQKTYDVENLDYQLKTIENCSTQTKLDLYAEILSSFK